MTGEERGSRVYELLGTPWTFPQVAEVLNQKTGKAILYREVSPQEL